MDEELTPELKAGNEKTLKHINRVRELLDGVVADLLLRGHKHDQSKLVEPEASVFAEYGPKLDNIPYGSDEYKLNLREMKPALDHHYANNSHHPEYHVNGIHDMGLCELIEMVIDWKASGERNKDGGDIYKSLEINIKRFKPTPEIVYVLEMIIKELFGDE